MKIAVPQKYHGISSLGKKKKRSYRLRKRNLQPSKRVVAKDLAEHRGRKRQALDFGIAEFQHFAGREIIPLQLVRGYKRFGHGFLVSRTRLKVRGIEHSIRILHHELAHLLTRLPHE